MAKRSRKPKAKDIIKLAALVLLAALAVFRYVDTASLKADLPETDSKYSYHFIDVGQGDCTLILSDEASVVVDSGPGDHTHTTVEYIKQFTDEIDAMILTHPHEDHIGAADVIIEDIGVKTVIMPDASSETACFEKLLDTIEENDCSVEEGKAGERFSFGDIDIELYAPNSESYSDTNNYSIVAKVITGNVSAVITGDAESASEKEILTNFPAYKLDADILKVGHHGSSTSTTSEFLEAVSPEYAMISCGEGNSYGHPHDSLISLLENYSIDYYRTDTMGTVVCYSDGEKTAVNESYTSNGDYQRS